MTSRKLLEVERTVNTYLMKNSALIANTNIDIIPFTELKNIVPSKGDDPLLYDGYVLGVKELEQLNSYLPEKINLEFDLHFYVLECYGIYE